MKMENINHVAIIGTGMIGASMAALFTGNGYPTTMLAINEQEKSNGKCLYDTCFGDLIEKKLVTAEQAARCEKLLSFTFDYSGIADADFIFECVVERMDVKFCVYEKIEEYCKQFKVLASSTSAMSADDLAEGLSKNKDKLVVAHPYSPPHLVPFVEVVKSKYTTEETAQTAYDVLESTGRKVIIMQRCAPGFVANRLQHALLREAVHIVEQGLATPRDIDKALMYSFMPRYTSVGLFEHQDAAGLDMVKSIEDYLLPTLSNANTTPDYINKLVSENNLGMKTGKGIYDWPKEAQDDFRRRASAPYLRYFNWDIPKE
ncbi:MAG TPA: 3-hydroxyacyl-CoA dehydrogenase family protein [Anaerovoracaceae bacterium]|nr:3-hydroxyacyl-CoA dehydrogenase family protein [Anaerovoracaceae bacterium]